MIIRFTCEKYGLTTKEISPYTSKAPNARVHWENGDLKIEGVWDAEENLWEPETDQEKNEVLDTVARHARRKKLDRWCDYFVEVDVGTLIERGIKLPEFANEDDYVIGLWIRGKVNSYEDGPPKHWHHEAHVKRVRLWNFSDGEYIYEACQDIVDDQIIDRELSI